MNMKWVLVFALFFGSSAFASEEACKKTCELNSKEYVDTFIHEGEGKTACYCKKEKLTKESWIVNFYWIYIQSR